MHTQNTTHRLASLLALTAALAGCGGASDKTTTPVSYTHLTLPTTPYV